MAQETQTRALYQSGEGGGRWREVQTGGGVGIPMADSC